MGLRAYLLVEVVDEMEVGEFVQEIRDLEEIPGVDFVDPVIGEHDLVIMVEAPVAVDAVTQKVMAKKWVKSVKTLRVVSMFERHRTSEQGLDKAMAFSGV